MRKEKWTKLVILIWNYYISILWKLLNCEIFLFAFVLVYFDYTKRNKKKNNGIKNKINGHDIISYRKLVFGFLYYWRLYLSGLVLIHIGFFFTYLFIYFSRKVYFQVFMRYSWFQSLMFCAHWCFYFNL